MFRLISCAGGSEGDADAVAEGGAAVDADADAEGDAPVDADAGAEGDPELPERGPAAAAGADEDEEEGSWVSYGFSSTSLF